MQYHYAKLKAVPNFLFGLFQCDYDLFSDDVLMYIIL